MSYVLKKKIYNLFRKRWFSHNSVDSVDHNKSSSEIVHYKTEYILFKTDVRTGRYYNILGFAVSLHATKKQNNYSYDISLR